MSWQLSCHGMCKIVTWLDRYFSCESNLKCNKILMMSSWSICEMGPWISREEGTLGHLVSRLWTSSLGSIELCIWLACVWHCYWYVMTTNMTKWWCAKDRSSCFCIETNELFEMISVPKCRTVVFPMHQQWRYHSLEPGHITLSMSRTKPLLWF